MTPSLEAHRRQLRGIYRRHPGALPDDHQCVIVTCTRPPHRAGFCQRCWDRHVDGGAEA